MLELELKALILERYKSLHDFSKTIGMPSSTLDNIFRRGIENSNSQNIFKICKALNISADELAQGRVTNNISVFSYKNVSPIGKQRFAMIGKVACGKPILANEEVEYYVEVGVDIKADFCVKAVGDSMINARIHDGDIVFIREQPTVENGEIAAVLIGDEVTLKRVFYQQGKKITLQAENHLFEPLTYIGEELNQIRILGKAVAFQSDVK